MLSITSPFLAPKGVHEKITNSLLTFILSLQKKTKETFIKKSFLYSFQKRKICFMKESLVFSWEA